MVIRARKRKSETVFNKDGSIQKTNCETCSVSFIPCSEHKIITGEPITKPYIGKLPKNGIKARPDLYINKMGYTGIHPVSQKKFVKKEQKTPAENKATKPKIKKSPKFSL